MSDITKERQAALLESLNSVYPGEFRADSENMRKENSDMTGKKIFKLCEALNCLCVGVYQPDTEDPARLCWYDSQHQQRGIHTQAEGEELLKVMTAISGQRNVLAKLEHLGRMRLGEEYLAKYRGGGTDANDQDQVQQP